MSSTIPVMAGNPLPIEDILRNHNGHFVVVLTPTDVVDAPITVTVPTKRKVDDDGPITLSTKRLCEILDESQAIKQRREGSESRLINIIPELKSYIISFVRKTLNPIALHDRAKSLTISARIFANIFGQSCLDLPGP